MSLWPAIALVLLVAIAILWRFAKPSGPLALGVAAGLAAGLAGYVIQGRPDLPSHPDEPRAEAYRRDTSFAKQRGALLANLDDVAAWLHFANALTRAGRTDREGKGKKVA